jgi:transcription elongation GreA/GreB family factor
MQVATVPGDTGDTVTRNSPLGRALTDAHPGDRITYPGPDGMINAQVIAIRPPTR